jgi:DNA-binding LacI/PurR family transcriptional regulator
MTEFEEEAVPRTRRATIADVAARAGVSIGAVSFALNDRPGVSAETRERIRAIARELDWRPHSAALALSGARAGAVGLVLNRPARALGTESFFGDLLSGIQLGLRGGGPARSSVTGSAPEGRGAHIALNLLVARDLDEELEVYREWWSGHRVDGVIVIDPREDDARLRLLTSIGMPHVVVGSHESATGAAPSVWIDDSSAADMLFGYLHALGHRRLAYVAGRAEFEHTALRARALASFAEAVGLESAETIPTDYSAGTAAAATREMLSRPVRPTVVVYDNDVLAMAGLGVAAEMGVTVPQALSIASFDDSILAQLARPAITALTRDTVELGERATRLLLEQIASPLPLASRQGPPLTLSVRESTAVPPLP